ncbi:MAG: CoB--CoM heterodisulfide reductase iron-sulfur subunit A family protein [Deltaproteobacteria bacterium]|nr:MAG: CoB--CoM heterodisulfide reductase iron-sulfur subunit A family protein [Deltaproteobacteria bacterium]
MTSGTGPVSGTILVVGGGISGLTAALEAAEVGYDVILVEKNPYLGGRVAQLNKYFPKLCPPTCGLEINFKRIKTNPRLKFYTLAEVEKVSGSPGNYDVSVKITPRYVNEKCVACNACAEVCPVTRENDFNFGMDMNKAAYKPHDMAFPMQYVIDGKVCQKASCAKCVEVCKYDAIDLKMEPKTLELKVGSIVWATGWNPYDATKMDNLGFGKYKNVITNMMMERLAAPNGPTAGKITRPSDGKEIQKIAFVQCAGSRDENHLPYCSYICCLASLKQATYVAEQYPEAKISIYYIDIRTPGRYENFYRKVAANPNISLIKGKVAQIEEDPATKDVTVVAENTATGAKVREKVDMAVLATGMQPVMAGTNISLNVPLNESSFVLADPQRGISACGCAKEPLDVVSCAETATGAAMKAIQTLVRR